MKKIISILLAVVLLMSLFCVPASAYFALSTDYIQSGTSAFDMSAYGVNSETAEHDYLMPYYYAYKVGTPANIDGTISSGEYPATPNKATLNFGLYVTDAEYSVDATAASMEKYEGTALNTFIAYDEKYVYIAEELTLPFMITLNQINSGLALGLNQSDSLPEAYSSLSNKYIFKYDKGSYSVNSVSALKRTIQSLSVPDQSFSVLVNKNYVSVDGTDWKPATYKNNTAISYKNSLGAHIYTMEFKIPLADAIRSQSQYTVQQLLAKGVFNGTLAFTINTDSVGNEYLASGTSVQRKVSPYISYSKAPDITWGEAISEYWQVTGDGNNLIDYIPIGIWFAGEYNPSNPFVVSTSKLVIPKEYSGVGISAGYGVKIGDMYRFKAIGDGFDNTEIIPGSKRIAPAKWELRVNNTTVRQKGVLDENYEGVINTSKLTPGRYMLVVKYVEQIYNGTNWENTSNISTKTRTFTINGTVQGASNDKAAQTGDKFTVVLIASGAMLLAAAAFTGVYVFKKKKAE